MCDSASKSGAAHANVDLWRPLGILDASDGWIAVLEGQCFALEIVAIEVLISRNPCVAFDEPKVQDREDQDTWHFATIFEGLFTKMGLYGTELLEMIFIFAVMH